jgi:hypothetical protein
MKWRHLVFVPAAIGILGSVAARPSRAEDRPCTPMTVETDARVAARWPDLQEQVRQAFEARANIDTCARVEVTMTNAAIAVAVVLPDGRAASRRVSRQEDVLPTLQALLVMPADQRPEVPAPTILTATSRESPAGLPAPVSGRLGIELSALAGVRAGDGQMGGGLGVLTFVDLTGWLVGFAGRADFYEELEGGPPAGALVLAILGGRRFRSGTLALDVAGGPAVAMLGTMTSVTQAGPAVAPVRESRSMGARPRLLVGTRLSFRARSVVRTFVGVDGEFGSARAPVLAPRDVGRLPVWTVGLLLGATVGTP